MIRTPHTWVDGRTYVFPAIQQVGGTTVPDVANANGEGGIEAFDGATANTIIGNVARNNGLVDLVDDDSASGDSNVWRGNDFGTSFPSCIHKGARGTARRAGMERAGEDR